MRCKGKTTNGHGRKLDHITLPEYEQLLLAAKDTRWATRNQLILSLLFRHGFRNSEVTQCRLEDINLESGHIWVRRVKGGLSTQHPLLGSEVRLIKRYLRIRPKEPKWLVLSEREDQLTISGVYRLVRRIGKLAGMDNLHPHMLRHGCGYYLAHKGYDLRMVQDYLGHRDPQHTARYARIPTEKREAVG